MLLFCKRSTIAKKLGTTHMAESEVRLLYHFLSVNGVQTWSITSDRPQPFSTSRPMTS